MLSSTMFCAFMRIVMLSASECKSKQNRKKAEPPLTSPAYCSTLKMEMTGSFETLVTIFLTV
jgi:hypothetical protein